MSSDRSLLERHMADVSLRPFTLDEFHRRRHRKQRNRRIATTVVGVVLAAAAIGGVFQTVASDGDHKAITDDAAGPPLQPASPYVGRWLSTDADGSAQSMEIQPVSGTNDLRMEYHDEAATAMCAGGAATIIGTGQVQTNGTLIVAAEGTCDDGSTPTPMANPDTASEFLNGLANMIFVHDPETDEITNGDVIWRRPGAEPSGDASPGLEGASPFEGSWVTDGTEQISPAAMDITRLGGGDTHTIVMHGTDTTRCRGGDSRSTITGTGRRETDSVADPDSSELVFAVELTCDDGSPLQPTSRDDPLIDTDGHFEISFIRDPATDELAGSLGGLWWREGAERT
jgi:hypothetical protein